MTSPKAHSEAVFESELGAHLFCRPVQSFVDSSMSLTFGSTSTYNSTLLRAHSVQVYTQRFMYYLI